MSVYWLTYETNPEVNNKGTGSYKKMAITCRSKGLSKPIIMGAGAPWSGFSAKWKVVEKFCKEVAKPKDVVIVTDARDVLCNRDHRGLVAAFNKVSSNGKKLIFGPEMGCCVDPMKEYGPGEIHTKKGKKVRKAMNSKKWDDDEEYGDELDESGYYNNMWTKYFGRIAPKNARSGVALNAGLGIGLASRWASVIPMLKIKSNSEDDQTLWSSLMWARGKGVITLDYSAKIFTNTDVWNSNGCFVTWDPRRKSWKNRKTQTYSYIIQSPGAPNDTYKGKAWSCYMEMYSALKNSK